MSLLFQKINVFLFFNYVLFHDRLPKTETILNMYPITVLLAHRVLRSACNDVVIREKKQNSNTFHSIE